MGCDISPGFKVRLYFQIGCSKADLKLEESPGWSVTTASVSKQDFLFLNLLSESRWLQTG